jgi:homoserine dehydrogenase
MPSQRASGRCSKRSVAIFQLGLGRVGRALLEMILEYGPVLGQRTGVSLCYVGLADSRSAIWDSEGLSSNGLYELLRRKVDGNPLAKPCPPVSGASIEDNSLPHPAELSEFCSAVVVDTTASEDTGAMLCRASEDGWGVALANKLPLAGSIDQYATLARRGAMGLGYESTVGAGLPVISTLRGLLDTGDSVVKADGCLSGTLGFVCYCLQEGMSFSSAVSEAHEMGYTEPDPRQDLGGLDVARKALILARTMGKQLHLADVELESLYPESMSSMTVPEFMANLALLNVEYRERVAQAGSEGNVLRYVAQVDDGGCSVGLREVDSSSLMGALRGPDNIVRFQTQRYGDNPVAIAGPGAGPAVTAAGVLVDILRLADAG